MSFSEAFAGFTAGVVNDVVLFHPDNLKYLSQNNIKPRPLTMATIPYHTRGIVPITMGGGLSWATYFYAYGLVKTNIDPYMTKLIAPIGPDGAPAHTALTQTVVAGLGGACAILPSTLVSFPFDSVKKHTSVLPELSASQVAQKIYREGGGLKGFFFGWNYTLSRDIYMSALKMGLFEGVSKFMVDHRDHPHYPQWIKSPGEDGEDGNDDNTHGKRPSSTLESSLLSPREVTASGLFSGTLTGLISTPIDCVVSRIRSPLTPAHAKGGFVKCAKWMIEQEPDKGVRIFFRGTMLRTFNYAMGSMIFWGLFSRIQKRAAPWFEEASSLTV